MCRRTMPFKALVRQDNDDDSALNLDKKKNCNMSRTNTAQINYMDMKCLRERTFWLDDDCLGYSVVCLVVPAQRVEITIENDEGGSEIILIPRSTSSIQSVSLILQCTYAEMNVMWMIMTAGHSFGEGFKW